MSVKFTPEQQARINEIVEKRVARERNNHAVELSNASQDLAFWKHRAAFYGGQIALLTEQNKRLTAMVGHPSNYEIQEQK